MGDPISRKSANTKKDVVVPIVFVPGIMGTRLEFPKQGISWDPDSGLEMYRKWYKRPAEEKLEVLDSKNPAKIIEEDVDLGWGTVPKDFYHSFLKFLHAAKFKGALCNVYATGYDWRQSCTDSGQYVAVKIGRAMELERAKRAIVITHSMGGLVTRAALGQKWRLEEKLLGAVHVVQPVSGAPVLYRRFFTGMVEGWDGDEYLTDILGIKPRDFVLVLSGLPGGFELLPTHQYRYIPKEIPEDEKELKLLHGPWESSELGTRDSWGRMVYPHGLAVKRFLDENSPPGLFNKKLHGTKGNRKLTAETKKRVETNIEAANKFHERLALKMHSNTWAMYGTGVETDVAVRYEMKKLKDMAYRRNDGDGTVPSASGGGLFGNSVKASAENAKSTNNRQFFVENLDHGLPFDNGAVRATIIQLIKLMLKSA